MNAEAAPAEAVYCEGRACTRESPTLQGRLGEQDAIIGDNAHGLPADGPETSDERATIERLELVKARAVQDPRQDAPHVPWLPRVCRHHACTTTIASFK